ncbi:hypothetical protein [Gorillibacterium sp. sgz5001074]|uniref:hypothetical protein n=1 Tax=Gorillibacterium sp. sgz5001074 TaxID=3446695 RepID=UPI003F671F20
MPPQDFMVYRDRTFGFSLRLPAWWKPYLTVRSSGKQMGAEYALHLIFRYKGIRYGDVLTVLVFRMSTKRWKRLYADSPLLLLGARGGLVAACMLPEELPYAFVDPDTGDYDTEKYGEQIRLMKRMVNEDAPRIIRSFRWTAGPAGSRLPKPYLAAGVLPGTGCGC